MHTNAARTLEGNTHLLFLQLFDVIDHLLILVSNVHSLSFLLISVSSKYMVMATRRGPLYSCHNSYVKSEDENEEEEMKINSDEQN